MATLLLPVRCEVPFSYFDVDLEGASYTIETRWNERAGLWFLSVSDKDGVPISAGRAVVLGADLLGKTVDARRPPGVILAIDSTGEDIEAGRDDLGARVQILYIESTGP